MEQIGWYHLDWESGIQVGSYHGGGLVVEDEGEHGLEDRSDRQQEAHVPPHMVRLVPIIAQRQSEHQKGWAPPGAMAGGK
eukprot:134972-Rhodomonas_salina.2